MVTQTLGVFTEDQFDRRFSADLSAARAAFGSDCGYAEQMAGAAVALAAREHAASLRAALTAQMGSAMAACSRAAGQFTCTVTSACGTGACRFASGPAAAPEMEVPACPGRVLRPSNHASPGSGFGAGPAQAALLSHLPHVVGARAVSRDYARAADAPAA